MTITAQQRADRPKNMGSSDTALLFNCSPYIIPEGMTQTQYLYWSKVGPLPDDKPNDAMETGNWLEAPLIKWAGQVIGQERRTSGYLLNTDEINAVDTLDPVMGVLRSNLDAAWGHRAELDGEAMRCVATCVIEAKYVGPNNCDEWGDDGTDQVPDHVALQVHTQMLCTGAEQAVVVAALDKYRIERRMYRLRADRDIERAIRRAASDFWNNHVIPKIPPTDWKAPPLSIARRKVREAGAIATCGETRPLAAFLIARRERERWENVEDRIKAALVDMMGTAETLQFPTGARITFKGHDRKDLDREALKFNFPDAFAQCQKVTRVKPSFRYLKGKNDDDATAALYSEIGGHADEQRLIEAIRESDGQVPRLPPTTDSTDGAVKNVAG